MSDILRDYCLELTLIGTLVALVAIAFGVNWMAYEQMRANTIFIIPKG
jgi:hypothetical protein